MQSSASAGLLETLVTRAAHLLGSPHGFLYVATPDGAALEMKVLVGDKCLGRRVRADEGILGRIWQSGQPLAVEDHDTWEQHSSLVDPGVLGSVLGVPLRSGPNVVGVLGLAHDAGSGRVFGDEEIRQLSGFAQLASIGLDTTRFFETEQAAREQAERLLAATRALSVTMDLPEVLTLILRELRQVVPYDSASVQELRGNCLVIVGGHGFPDPQSILGLSLDLASGAYPNSEVVVSRRAPLVLADAWETYPGFRSQPHAQAAIRSWLGVPLLFADRLVGILTLDKREPGFYSGDHARLVQAFARRSSPWRTPASTRPPRRSWASASGRKTPWRRARRATGSWSKRSPTSSTGPIPRGASPTRTP